ncbi:hypothetical protein NW752_004187 [Fusarium irregulare]|uniref:Polyketide synthase n=1 Tax=Fusarium irregulare TaxID=2494466 RepID=A0A9W8PMN3_9HYPO|nr:hypothetical protein NW766_007086 [Fusarium irregulare]KAJ4021180.1 hypothetical protein NW752_004187 [Fusarium irregulare]
MESPKTMPIAIIGMSCKFSGTATSPEQLWQMVAEARSGWSTFPKDRFNGDAFYHPISERLASTQVKGAHFIQQDIGLFDASFFNFSVEVAATMDPQVRLQLESAFEAFENAGLTIEALAGSDTGVFAGEFVKDYYDSLMRDPETIPRFFVTGNGVAMMSARVSHFFDLRGPCLTLDTGCSTGLTALHQACQSIRCGESKMAVVSGSNVLLNPDMFNQMSATGLLSKEGRSFSFDSRGTGYGRGEGVATLVIKSLEDALRDNDPIRAVIRETALNQDGKTPTITSPSEEAQAMLMRACYDRAGLDPTETAYIEAHGTGTRTGDPIEARAIHSVLGGKRSSDKPLLIGSIKSNIGHTEAASGLAGVIKVVMSIEKGIIPPNYDFRVANPNVPFDEFNMKVPVSLTSWPENLPRRASVNSFGYGGTNGHVIIEDAAIHTRRTRQDELRSADSWKVFRLSGKDEVTTKLMVSQLKEYLTTTHVSNNKVLLDRLAYTLDQRRSRFTWNTAVVGKTKAELISALDPAIVPLARSDSTPRLGFVFTGQGAQWHAMGRELIVSYPAFRESILQGELILKDLGCTWSATEELLRDTQTTRVNQVMLSLPLCCLVQMALVRLLRSWGIHPTAVTGHSSGEVGAAFAANALNMREALAVVWSRGTLTEEFQRKIQRKGGMLAAGLSRDEAAPYLENLTCWGKAVVACVNSPSSVTLSGDVSAIVELDVKLKRQNIFARRLKVDAAYHSEHMEVFADYYLDYLMERMSNDGDFDGVVFSSPTTGKRIAKAQDLGPSHWVENMVKPVEFLDSFTNMCIDTTIPESDPSRKSVDIVVEIGPHGALSGPIRQILQTPELKGLGVQYASCLTRGQDAVMTMQNLAAVLVSKGFPVNLEAVNFPSGASRLPTLHDLPSYPWNHQTRYWSEPRLNRQHRLREYPDHDLLGVRVVGTNPATPTWRHIIRQKELPWVTDHRVQSTVIYPAAGYVCMAIEGARQYLGTKGSTITGFKFRNIDIASALIIPDTNEGIEAQLQLRSCDKDKTLGCEGWYEFQISSVTTTDEWSHHCRGFISASTSIGEPERRMVEKLDNMRFENKITAKPSQIFESIHRLGVQHGPIFQNITQVETDGGSQSLVSFGVKNTAKLMPNEYEHEHVLHPTTLDSTVVAAFTALPGAGLNQTTGMIPQHIGSLFVSTDAPRDPGTQLQVLTNISESSQRGFMASSITWACDGLRKIPVVEIADLYFKAMGDTGNENAYEGSGKLCATVRWSPSLTHVPNDELKKMLSGVSKYENLDSLSDLKIAAFYFIRLALENLDEADIAKLTGAHRKFYDWMVQQNKLAKLNELGAQSLAWLLASDEERESLVSSLRNHSVSSQMLCRVGENIVPILKGEVTALELMLEGGLLYRFYEEDMRVVRSHEHLKKYLSMYAHEYPRANIIELGAGVGGCTQAALQALAGDDSANEPLFSHYDFTDISAGFFSTARERFSVFGDRINYRKLDLEMDPSEQSFEAGTYDLVIACRVLHATKLMSKTMAHVRKLLKPGGKLIIIEDTTNSLDHQVIYGVLPGWWLAEEDDRKHSATMPVTTWNSILQHSGFSSLELEVPAFEEEEYQSSSFMVSTAVASSPASYDSVIYVVHSSSQPPAQWITNLGEDILKLTGSRLETLELGSADLTGKTCLFLEFEEPVLAGLSAEKYAQLQTMLLTSKGVFWVTRGAAIGSEKPLLALSQGLLRTLRIENPGKRYISLDLDATPHPWTSADTSVISRVLQSTFDLTVEAQAMDFEYAERGGSIQIPRLVERPDMDEIATGSGEPDFTLQPFLENGKKLCLEGIYVGDQRTLAFRSSSTGGEPLPADFVEIVPQAFGANQMAFQATLGQTDDAVRGLEIAGTITRIGGSVTDLSVGQRVCALVLQGSYGNLVHVPITNIAKIPESLTFEVAVTLPITFITAYSALYEFARLQPTETVLIHNGMGDTGQAAISLAKLAGAEVITTVSTREEHYLLSKTLDIPATHIFSSSDTSFSRGIMELTNGKGVDVVLSSLSGELLRESWHCIAPFGRFCQIGQHDAKANHGIEMGPFQRMTSFATIDAIYLAKHQPNNFNRVLKEVVALVTKDQLSPIEPITTYGMSQIEQAFTHLQTGQQKGKTVILVEPAQQVKVVSPELSIQLSPDRSYLIVGGMGGIGQAISKHLVHLGARNLILVSRSAEQQIEASQVFLKDLKAAGCTVCVRSCDVTNDADLQRVVEECEQETAPVDGVIQAAMVLRDTIFDQMSFEDYTTAVRPKVMGTWNLHNHFIRHSLSFFIILSSFVGVGGNGGQANYAAGGAFEDAVSRHRAAAGLPSVTIDLGAVKEIGYLTENETVAGRLAKLGYKALGEKEVLELVEAAIKKPLRDTESAQIVTGILGSEWGNAPWANDPRFAVLKPVTSTTTSQAGVKVAVDLKTQLVTTTTLREGTEMIVTGIVRKISDMFSAVEDEIDVHAPLSRYGVDSLVAVEIRNWLNSSTKADVSIFDVMQSPSLLTLASKVAGKSGVLGEITK